MTNEERKVIELAIEWIEKQPEETPKSKYDVDTRYVVLRELEAALAQPEQEYGVVAGVGKGVEIPAGVKYYYIEPKLPSQPKEPDQDEVDIRSRLYQRIHELECVLKDIAEYTGEGPPTTDWQGIVKLISDSARNALEDKEIKQPEQEPVGQLLEDAFGRGQVMWFNKPKDESMLYTTPPQRNPLTDDEMWKLWNSQGDDAMEQQAAIAFARDIEAAHNIKE